MPAQIFFKMLSHAEENAYKDRNTLLFELCDVFPIANTTPEYKTQLQKIYQKRVLGPTWRDPEERVFEPDDKRAVAWMNQVFKQANKLMGSH